VRQTKEFGFAEIFIEEHNDVFAGLAAFLRRHFTPPVPRTRHHQQQGQPY
jgi:hypothetical protein